jgi:hypothetical protein
MSRRSGTTRAIVDQDGQGMQIGVAARQLFRIPRRPASPLPPSQRRAPGVRSRADARHGNRSLRERDVQILRPSASLGKNRSYFFQTPAVRGHPIPFGP